MEWIIGLIVLGAIGAIIDEKEDFIYKRKHGEWRAYFKKDPPSRQHLYHDNDGYYVCWDRPVKSERDAKAIAREWMKCYGRK